MPSSDAGGDRGSVTAEAATALPALVLFTMALGWALVAAAREAAPSGARVAVERAGDLWHVRVEAPTPGPGSLRLTLRAEAAALAEDTVGVEP